MSRLRTELDVSLAGRLKWARLLEMPEAEYAALQKKLEGEPLFKKLLAGGVLRLHPFPKAFFATRRFSGWQFAATDESLPGLLDGKSELVRLMKRIGRKKFEEYFLSDTGLSDALRSKRCGISVSEARQLREWMDKLYVRESFSPAPPAAPRKIFSVVAAVGVEGGEPRIKHFNREVWKGRYQVDEKILNGYLRGLEDVVRRKIERLVSRMRFLDSRKTTLRRALEALIQAQTGYLASGDPGRLEAVTQRSLAAAIGADPSVVNRLISNKAVELPWGTEAPMKCFLPSAKRLGKTVLESLARRNPDLSDEKLRELLAQRHQILLSRRSVAQYRKELGLGRRHKR